MLFGMHKCCLVCMNIKLTMETPGGLAKPMLKTSHRGVLYALQSYPPSLLLGGKQFTLHITAQAPLLKMHAMANSCVKVHALAITTATSTLSDPCLMKRACCRQCSSCLHEDPRKCLYTCDEAKAAFLCQQWQQQQCRRHPETTRQFEAMRQQHCQQCKLSRQSRHGDRGRI